MRKVLRQIIFINTSPPDERVEFLKPIEDIKEMDDDSKEICTTGLLQRYCKHPPKLENLTLADWAAWYDNCSSKPYIKHMRLTLMVFHWKNILMMNKMMMMMSLSRQQTVKQGNIIKLGF